MSRIPISHKDRIRGEERHRKRADLNLSTNINNELAVLNNKIDTEIALRPLFDNVADLVSKSPARGLVVSTRRYYVNEAPVPNMDFIIMSPADYGGVPDGYVDFYVASGDVAKNISNVLTGSMGGMRSDGADYTLNLQALAAQLNPKRSLYVDSTSFSLSGFILFNNGFKEVSHASNCVVTFLGAGEPSSTTKALYSINVDINGTSTNETVLTTTAAVTNKGGNSFTLIDASAFQEGDAIRINKHVCIITDIFGNVVYTDRTLPIRQLASGSEVSRLDVPNTNSRMEGPALIKFAPNRTTQYYGMGVRASYCVGITISNFNSLYNASGLAELVGCADSYLAGIYQKSPTSAGSTGLSYAGQLSDGNDNTAQNLRSHEGRHCASISFSHRNKVMDCIDFQGTNASYLTQHNGCRENTFINCDLVNCSFGVYLGGQFAGAGAVEDLADGDQSNIIQDSRFINSRGLYRMTRKNKAVNCQFINDTVTPFREVFVPRSNGESTFTIENCEIDIVNTICDVSVEFTLNMRGGFYSNTNIDTLFKGTVISNNIANIVFQNDPTSSELPFEGSLF